MPARYITFETDGEIEIHDLTEEVRAKVHESGVADGLACVFTASSTTAITTLEHEPGLVEEDVPKALDRLFPRHGDGLEYGHQRMWQDGNGHSHVRAAFLGPSLTVPIVDGELTLGQWQQIVFLEMDNKPRQRRVLVQVIGD